MADILLRTGAERYEIHIGKSETMFSLVCMFLLCLQIYQHYSLFNVSHNRWFYTSDTVVKEVSIDEVLSVSAYMLFYDRGTGPSRQPI